jgi:hypothetical protein
MVVRNVCSRGEQSEVKRVLANPAAFYGVEAKGYTDDPALEIPATA